MKGDLSPFKRAQARDKSEVTGLNSYNRTKRTRFFTTEKRVLFVCSCHDPLPVASPFAVQHSGQRVSPATRALTNMPCVAWVMPEQVA